MNRDFRKVVTVNYNSLTQGVPFLMAPHQSISVRQFVFSTFSLRTRKLWKQTNSFFSPLRLNLAQTKARPAFCQLMYLKEKGLRAQMEIVSWSNKSENAQFYSIFGPKVVNLLYWTSSESKLYLLPVNCIKNLKTLTCYSKSIRVD